MGDLVVLVARSYGWRCQECGEEHIVSSAEPKVTCSQCGTVYGVARLEHNIPGRARRVDLTQVGLEPVRSDADEPLAPPEPPPFDETWAEMSGVPMVAAPSPRPAAPAPAPAAPPPPPPLGQAPSGGQMSLFAL